MYSSEGYFFFTALSEPRIVGMKRIKEDEIREPFINFYHAFITRITGSDSLFQAFAIINVCRILFILYIHVKFP